MNSMPDCLPSRSSDETRSAAGRLIECFGNSMPWARAVITQTQQISPAMTPRFTIFAYTIGRILRLRDERRLTLGQDYYFAASVGLYGEAALYETNEALCIVSSEVATNVNIGNGWILDDDLMKTIAIELDNRIGEPRVTKSEVACTPT